MLVPKVFIDKLSVAFLVSYIISLYVVSALSPSPRLISVEHPRILGGLSFQLDLPQVAVVGSQSSGKSSVLESLVDFCCTLGG